MMIRVPKKGEIADVPEAANDSSPFAPAENPEKASYAPANSIEDLHEQEDAARSPPQISSSPAKSSPGKNLSAPAVHGAPTSAGSELHCTCPVCQSELRISVAAESVSETPRNSSEIKNRFNEPQLKQNAQPAAKSTKDLTLEEREQQIAAARQLHPVAAYSPIKPRLDRILGDDANKELAD
jgi:hypothetical protein